MDNQIQLATFGNMFIRFVRLDAVAKRKIQLAFLNLDAGGDADNYFLQCPQSVQEEDQDAVLLGEAFQAKHQCFHWYKELREDADLYRAAAKTTIAFKLQPYGEVNDQAVEIGQGYLDYLETQSQADQKYQEFSALIQASETSQKTWQVQKEMSVLRDESKLKYRALLSRVWQALGVVKDEKTDLETAIVAYVEGLEKAKA